MNRFVSKRSALFLLATWCVAVALFADGINLDDLIPGNFVVHDEDDNPFSAGYSYDSAPVALPSGQHQAPQPQGTQKRQDSQNSNSRLQTVYDQDSPSLASDPLATIATESIFVADSRQIEIHQFSSSEPLHLLLHVLLI